MSDREKIAHCLEQRFGKIRWATRPIKEPIDWLRVADEILEALR